MRELKKAYSKHGFEILGVASDQKATLEKFFEKKGDLPWPNILDEGGKISGGLKIRAFPTYFLIDKTGKHVGTPFQEDEMNETIAKLLGVEPVEIGAKK